MAQLLSILTTITLELHNSFSYYSSEDELDKQDHTILDDRVYFKSPNGIRVVEAQCKLSEVIKHWEYIEDKPQNIIAIQKDEILCGGKTVTIEVYDGEGRKASFNLRNFVSRQK